MRSLKGGTEKSQTRAFPSVSFPWVIVILGALLLVISNVYQNTFGVFFKPIAGEFGWSREAVSGAYAICPLVTAIFAIPMGYWSDRYGPRRIMLPCSLLLGMGFLSNAKVTTLWQFFLVQGLLFGIGMSGPWVCVMATVAKWHKKNPGLALGITSAGTGLSSVIFPPLAAMLIQAVAWRGALVVLGLVTLVVAAPTSVFMRNPLTTTTQQSGDSLGKHGGRFEAWHVIPQFLKNQTFLALIVMFFFFYVACNMLTNHLVNYATDAGISSLAAATMMSVVGIGSIIGRLAMGTMSDRIGTKANLTACCTCVALSLILLILKVPVLMWVAAVLFGVGYGGGAPLIPAIMKEHFGTAHLATMTGSAYVGVNFGNAIGPWMGGFIFDISNSYLWALALSATFTIMAMVIVLRLPNISRVRLEPT